MGPRKQACGSTAKPVAIFLVEAVEFCNGPTGHGLSIQGRIMFFRQIGVKVTIVVNMMLFIVISLGTFYLVTQQYASLQEIYQDEGNMMSAIGAKAVSRIMEDAVDNGAFAIKDVFDVKYVPMEGTDP